MIKDLAYDIISDIREWLIEKRPDLFVYISNGVLCIEYIRLYRFNGFMIIYPSLKLDKILVDTIALSPNISDDIQLSNPLAYDIILEHINDKFKVNQGQ